MDHQDHFSTNKDSWNKKVREHMKSDMYGMEAFLKGRSSLNSYELEALGDLSGKSLLHLQCHFGQDTISLARMGASCTGIDISDEAINQAKQLAAETGIKADFICCNVLDTSHHTDKTFDIVFTSYGVIGWLPDLEPWAKMIAERLNPGGSFYMVEFHPIPWMFDYLKEPAEMRYPYWNAETIYEEYKGTYANPNADIISKEYNWNHSLSEVIGALLEAGLIMELFEEHIESPYDVFPGLTKSESGMYRMDNPIYPLIFELKCKKP